MGASAAIMMGTSSLTTAFAQSSAQQSQGNFQKAVAGLNANLADMDASTAIQNGEFQANQQLDKTRQLQGFEKAAAAAQGLDVNSGSAAEIRTDSNTLGQLDALTIKNNAYRTAWGYGVQALNYTAQGEFDQMATENNSQMTLLTGGLQAASSFSKAYGISQYGNQYGAGY